MVNRSRKTTRMEEKTLMFERIIEELLYNQVNTHKGDFALRVKVIMHETGIMSLDSGELKSRLKEAFAIDFQSAWIDAEYRIEESLLGKLKFFARKHNLGLDLKDLKVTLHKDPSSFQSEFNDFSTDRCPWPKDKYFQVKVNVGNAHHVASAVEYTQVYEYLSLNPYYGLLCLSSQLPEDKVATFFLASLRDIPIEFSDEDLLRIAELSPAHMPEHPEEFDFHHARKHGILNRRKLYQYCHDLRFGTVDCVRIPQAKSLHEQEIPDANYTIEAIRTSRECFESLNQTQPDWLSEQFYRESAAKIDEHFHVFFVFDGQTIVSAFPCTRERFDHAHKLMVRNKKNPDSMRYWVETGAAAVSSK